MPVASGDPRRDDLPGDGPPGESLPQERLSGLELPDPELPGNERLDDEPPDGQIFFDELPDGECTDGIPPGWREVDGYADDSGDDGGQAGDLATAFGFGTGEQADEMAPGPTLAVLTDRVVDDGVDGLDDDQLVGVLAAARRIGSWATAVEADAAGELCRRRESTGRISDLKYLADELAAALTTSVRAGEALAGFVSGLMALPATLAALRAREIDRSRANVIVDELAWLDPARAAAVEQLIIGAAANQTAGQLRHRVRRAVLAADPAAAERRRQERQREARVELYDEQSGTAALSGRDLPTAAALAADAGIDASARALKAAGSPLSGGSLGRCHSRRHLPLAQQPIIRSHHLAPPPAVVCDLA